MASSGVSDLILYGTDGCHLCELAEALLAPLLGSHSCELIDIVDSDALMERYGVRIPVLVRAADGAELGWPFAEGELREFLAGA